MTVGELMGLLEDEPENAIVRIVHQEAWPLHEDINGEPDEESVIFLVADGHPQHGSPYGSKSAWNVMRRGRR